MEAIQRSHITLKQVFQDNWWKFLAVHKTLITSYMAFNVWKIMNCREPDGLGYITYACPDHPEQTCQVPISCKSRFCSVCAKVQIDRWVSDMNQRFPKCTYFHVTFTVPSQYRTLLFEKRTLLNAVFSAGTETLLSFCKEQGFLPAITAVSHTFGSDLKRHVHIHCIVSAGGLALTGKQERYTRFIKRKARNPKVVFKKVEVLTRDPEWISWNKFPYRMLQKRYQALLIKHLKALIIANIHSDNPDRELAIFAQPVVMQSFFEDLKQTYKNGFFVHITEERQELEQTISYIGRYARRPPLSEVRIKDYTGDYISYEYKDYRNNQSKVLHTLKSFEFIRKLVRHIPPHYFNVIRHYGIIASRVKTRYQRLTDRLLEKTSITEKAPDWSERQTEYTGSNPLVCKICHKKMEFVSLCTPQTFPVMRKKIALDFSQ